MRRNHVLRVAFNRFGICGGYEVKSESWIIAELGAALLLLSLL